MKKLTNHKELNKIVTGALTIVLAGTFTFSATNAFAEEKTISTENNQTVEMQTNTSTEVNGIKQTTEKQETPALVPGDFFYFVKIALEKIQLAFTFDNVEEARNLASNASERLAEAESLFAAGDEEAALEVIKTAMEDMDNADKVVEEQQGAKQSSNEASDNKQVNEDQLTTNENQATVDQVTTDDQVSLASEDEVTAIDEVSGKDQATEDKTGIKEVKNVLSQNIIALTAAMEKVKNPVAKAALQKNINKSNAKLAKKIEKWEQKLVKKQEKEAKKNIEEEQATKDESSIKTETNATVEQTISEAGTEVGTNQEANVPLPTVTEEKEEQKKGHEVQTSQKAAQQEMKKTQQAAKQKRQEAKAIVKEKREEVKQKKEHGQNPRNGNNQNDHKNQN